MKVIMIEYYQDRNIVLAPSAQPVEVDNALGKWLLENRKAIAVKVEPPSPVVLEPAETQEQEQPEPEQPQTFEKPQSRSRRGK